MTRLSQAVAVVLEKISVVEEPTRARALLPLLLRPGAAVSCAAILTEVAEAGTTVKNLIEAAVGARANS